MNCPHCEEEINDWSKKCSWCLNYIKDETIIENEESEKNKNHVVKHSIWQQIFLAMCILWILYWLVLIIWWWTEQQEAIKRQVFFASLLAWLWWLSRMWFLWEDARIETLESDEKGKRNFKKILKFWWYYILVSIAIIVVLYIIDSI